MEEQKQGYKGNASTGVGLIMNPKTKTAARKRVKPK